VLAYLTNYSHPCRVGRIAFGHGSTKHHLVGLKQYGGREGREEKLGGQFSSAFLLSCAENGVGAEGAARLAEGLQYNTSLTELNLDGAKGEEIEAG